jgi:hypothetical protein
MDDLEARLKSLAVPEPPARLERRIFGPPPGRRGIGRVFDVRIPLSWAAVLVVAAGLAGFAGARHGKDRTPSGSPVAVTTRVEIVPVPATHHVFDFTRPSRDFLPGDVQVHVNANGEV